MGQYQRECVERSCLRVVVIVIRFDAHTGFRMRGGMRGKKMRMNLAGVRVIAIGTGVNVLKRREAECQQDGQACLDSSGATHHLRVYSRSVPAMASDNRRRYFMSGCYRRL
jgi:hypothetical protein